MRSDSTCYSSISVSLPNMIDHMPAFRRQWMTQNLCVVAFIRGGAVLCRIPFLCPTPYGRPAARLGCGNWSRFSRGLLCLSSCTNCCCYPCCARFLFARPGGAKDGVPAEEASKLIIELPSFLTLPPGARSGVCFFLGEVRFSNGLQKQQQEVFLLV